MQTRLEKARRQYRKLLCHVQSIGFELVESMQSSWRERFDLEMEYLKQVRDGDGATLTSTFQIVQVVSMLEVPTRLGSDSFQSKEVKGAQNSLFLFCITWARWRWWRGWPKTWWWWNIRCSIGISIWWNHHQHSINGGNHQLSPKHHQQCQLYQVPIWSWYRDMDGQRYPWSRTSLRLHSVESQRPVVVMVMVMVMVSV